MQPHLLHHEASRRFLLGSDCLASTHTHAGSLRARPALHSPGRARSRCPGSWPLAAWSAARWCLWAPWRGSCRGVGRPGAEPTEGSGQVQHAWQGACWEQRGGRLHPWCVQTVEVHTHMCSLGAASFPPQFPYSCHEAGLSGSDQGLRALLPWEPRPWRWRPQHGPHLRPPGPPARPRAVPDSTEADGGTGAAEGQHRSGCHAPTDHPCPLSGRHAGVMSNTLVPRQQRRVPEGQGLTRPQPAHGRWCPCSDPPCLPSVPWASPGTFLPGWTPGQESLVLGSQGQDRCPLSPHEAQGLDSRCVCGQSRLPPWPLAPATTGEAGTRPPLAAQGGSQVPPREEVVRALRGPLRPGGAENQVLVRSLAFPSGEACWRHAGLPSVGERLCGKQSSV